MIRTRGSKVVRRIRAGQVLRFHEDRLLVALGGALFRLLRREAQAAQEPPAGARDTPLDQGVTMWPLSCSAHCDLWNIGHGKGLSGTLARPQACHSTGLGLRRIRLHSSSATVCGGRHRRMVPSMPPDTIRLPSGEKATDKTQPLCPFIGSPRAARVRASHKRRVSSYPADTTVRPSGEKATDLTGPPCPRIGSPSG